MILQASTTVPNEQGRLKRSWLYSHGVFYSSGQDKGEVLDFIVRKMDKKYTSIIFVDDGEANINAMNKKLSSPSWSTIDSVVIHYTQVEDTLIKQQGSVLSTEQAQKMTADWNTLTTTLTTLFPDRQQLCPKQ